jgi:hypothetical protein
MKIDTPYNDLNPVSIAAHTVAEADMQLNRAALGGAARAASVMTQNIAEKMRGYVDSEICNSDSWENGVEPDFKMTLAEAESTSAILRRVASLLKHIGAAQ